MVRIKQVKLDGSHVGCKKLICDDSCWREATEKELRDMWKQVSDVCDIHEVKLQETWWGDNKFCPYCDAEEMEIRDMVD